MRYNQWNFIKHSRKFFTFSIAITVLGILTLLIYNLNYGVDFKAGSSLDIQLDKSVTEKQVDDVFKEVGIEPDSKTLGGDSDRVSSRFDKVLTEDQKNAIVGKFNELYGASAEENTVDPAIANEYRNNAVKAVLLSTLGIIAYVTVRFEWRFALAGIVALLHDAFIVISLFSILRLEVNLPFILAVLTIIGYSINDTIVIFDRIRENLRTAKLKNYSDLVQLVNTSIQQTFARSINTVMTVLVAALALFIFGSESIKLFSLAMIFGLLAGAYSSIFIASPLWLLLKRKSMEKAKQAVS